MINPRLTFAFSVLMLALLVSFPQTALAGIWPFGDDAIDFEIEIKGVSDASIEKYRLEELARQVIDDDKPPIDIDQLRAISLIMAERMRSIMVSRAYYNATVNVLVDDRTETKEDPLMRFDVISNKRYTVASSELMWGQPPLVENNNTPYHLNVGDYANAKPIVENAQAIREMLAKERCYISLEVTPRAVLDALIRTAEIDYEIDYGAEANFGETFIEGASTVQDDIIRKSIKWKQGECFDVEKQKQTQTTLLQTQLFASVTISHPNEPNERGEVDMVIEVIDRPHRTVSAGAEYEFDQGPGVSASWQHRNLTGRANDLSVKTIISQREIGADGAYTLPYFYNDAQKLRLSGAIKSENMDSFDSNNASVLAEVSRGLTDEISASVGLGARYSQVSEAGQETENFGLLFVTSAIEFDNRDNVLDPNKGILARGTITPYTDVTGQGVGFVRSEMAAQTYLTQTDWLWKPTLALRGAYGQINGANTTSIPADLRFYSGGGGSVRGYNFQAIGPRNNGEAEGGTVWTELSSEIRLRFTEEFGGVVFVDAGNTYQAKAPDPTEELFFSTGVGVRYYSPLGPLRLDVGVPLDEVEDDAAFGVYVSIGQAF